MSTKPGATPRTDAKAYTPFEDDTNEQVVNADFARTLELELAARDALLREALREWEIWMETGETVMGAETTAHKHRTRIVEIRRVLGEK